MPGAVAGAAEAVEGDVESPGGDCPGYGTCFIVADRSALFIAYRLVKPVAAGD